VQKRVRKEIGEYDTFPQLTKKKFSVELNDNYVNYDFKIFIIKIKKYYNISCST